MTMAELGVRRSGLQLLEKFGEKGDTLFQGISALQVSLPWSEFLLQ